MKTFGALVLLISILAQATVASAKVHEPPKGCGGWNPGYSLQGKKFHDVRAVSRNACKSACVSKEGCEGASFEPRRKRCWMYKDIEKFTATHMNKESLLLCAPQCDGDDDDEEDKGGEGDEGGKGCGRFYPQRGLKGTKIRDVRVRSTGRCQNKCKATAGCEGASFEPRRKRCWMYKNIKGFAVNKHKKSMILCERDSDGSVEEEEDAAEDVPSLDDDMAEDTTPEPGMCSGTCTYTLSVNMVWNSMTHPTDYPANGHFSPFYAITHDDTVTLWREGKTASDAIQEIAETGMGRIFDQMVNDCAECSDPVVLTCSPMSGVCAGSADFEVTSDRPYFSTASMLAPSPDWFTGVDSWSLCEGGEWVTMLSEAVDPWDGGTDVGPAFLSDNMPTKKREPIFNFADVTPMEASIFYNPHKGKVLPVGNVKVELVSCS